MDAALETMTWPTDAEIAATGLLPPTVIFRRFSDAELEALPDAIAAWYPTATVGSESVFCDRDFLARAATSSTQETDLLALRIERDGEFVGFLSFERQPAARTLHARLGLLAPAARTGLLGALGFPMFEAIGRLCRAELLLSWVTLASRHQQIFAERRGFRAVGVVPGFDRDRQPDGTVRRVYEALYAKALGDEVALRPAPEALTPAVRALLALIEPG